MLHGGDYNPDQWIDTPEVWDEDMRLMKIAGANAMSVGIFSWASLEPHEGHYEFGWLDAIMDKLSANGAFAVLATPSGSKPAWLSEAYPETCQVDVSGHREPHQGRHNHCRTSPVYRDKVTAINEKLATRYKNHPALLLWHVSNEYNGKGCHCPLCYDAFREWLKARYHNNLDELNAAWWSAFWSHTYTRWDQIRPIDTSIHGLILDWQRFSTDQTLDFFRAELEPLRRITPDTPATTNFMGFYRELDNWKLADEVDVISWDSYPAYHDRPDDWLIAVQVSMAHDMNRSFKGKPYLLMECSPGVQNWKPVNKLKRPGLHIVEAIQAIAHGSDSIQYFQWRKSRGGTEKFHGAVVDHYPTENTRVFGEVAKLGGMLGSLDDVVGTTTAAEVAIMYDWENRWAIDETAGPRNEGKEYVETCVSHYRPFWSAGVGCDVINEDCSLDKYRLLVAPMLYMVRPGVAERIRAFVENGGTLVTTYLSGIANESDLCFQNGFPGPFRDICGVWAEEIDVLYDNERMSIVAEPGNNAGLNGSYDAGVFCDLIHAEGATVLARYDREFYRGQPAVTVNEFGKGRAYYIASRNGPRFHADFSRRLIDDLGLSRALGGELPDGVTARVRTDGKREFVFVLGFNQEPVSIDLAGSELTDLFTNEDVSGSLDLPAYTVRVLTRPAT